MNAPIRPPLAFEDSPDTTEEEPPPSTCLQRLLCHSKVTMALKIMFVIGVVLIVIAIILFGIVVTTRCEQPRNLTHVDDGLIALLPYQQKNNDSIQPPFNKRKGSYLTKRIMIALKGTSGED